MVSQERARSFNGFLTQEHMMSMKEMNWRLVLRSCWSSLLSPLCAASCSFVAFPISLPHANETKTMPCHHRFNKTKRERKRERENWQLPFNPMNLSPLFLSFSLLLFDCVSSCFSWEVFLKEASFQNFAFVIFVIRSLSSLMEQKNKTQNSFNDDYKIDWENNLLQP